MTMRTIEKQAMRMSVHSRAKLAKKLLHSLDELSDSENEELWAQEALRRHEELIEGSVKSRSSNDVFQRVRTKLK